MPSTRARLSVADACTVIGDAGFGARPPGVGLELEWFVVDAAGRRVTDPIRIRDALDVEGPLPHGSRITFEPGGQLEISTPPAPDGPRALDVAETDGHASASAARRGRPRGGRRRRRCRRAPTAGRRRAALPGHGHVLRRAGRGGRHHDAGHRVAPGQRRLLLRRRRAVGVRPRPRAGRRRDVRQQPAPRRLPQRLAVHAAGHLGRPGPAPDPAGRELRPARATPGSSTRSTPR